MNIQSLNSAALRSVNSVSATTTSDDTTVDTTDDSTSSTVSLSKPAELFKQLSDLQQSDPAAFKQAASQIADQFKQEAASAQGPESEGLNRLADAFTQAAQNGNLSSLQRPQHHHSRRPPAQGAEGQPSTQGAQRNQAGQAIRA